MGTLSSWFWPIVIGLGFLAIALAGFRVIDWDIERMKRRRRS